MINLEKFAGGALAEKFNMAFQEVLDNIADPNTGHKAKRKITVELTFEPNEERQLSQVDVQVKTKLAPSKSVGTTILIDRDGQGGIIASEYNNQLKGQQYLRVDEETGEILSDDSEDVDIEGIRLIK